ncbi:acetyl-CoA C-acetyltransferase [Pseudodonghicola flavimaris]|uniref:Acetyl-CoA C-acetyltransferase n=1 Tax=Pseudodonghicola flavimaris TaxID=3050036 RepID=A0ABT7F591_9RHOB|nr:acetyl-CoA C-acetyltransferase [Pseudodonghicola flavimaris]MDK3019777.1 acetyl-CoA C-acetyltransferase [Pseudodonghicola flavimaris]
MTGQPDAFICDSIRTPRGKGRAGGGLATVKPVRLVADLLAELQRRSGLAPETVDDIVLGCVSPTGEQGGPIGRTAALLNGWQMAGPGLQVNRFCASGLEAITLAAQKIRSGWEHLVIAGGVESMSRVPMFSDGGAWQFDPEISGACEYLPQGISADLIASLGGMDRAMLDGFAARSHRQAAAAWDNGHFDRSVVPVRDDLGQSLLARDETIRPDTTPETLAALPPAFADLGADGHDVTALRHAPDLATLRHDHTAGNSSAIVDGAALLLVASAAMAARQGLRPRARILASGLCASDPVIMLTGPVEAARRALRTAGLGFDDIDLFEVNEAFAAVPLHFMAATDVPLDRINIDGGAIAMGHPLGATGAMLTGTLIDALERTGGRRGLVAMCIGAGMGTALVIERI